MKNYKLTDEFTLEGFWWLPESEDSEFYGSVHYAPNNLIVLTLIVNIDSYIDFFQDNIHIKKMFGYISDGRKVSLHRYEYRGKVSQTDEIVTIEYHFSLLFLGRVLFESESQTIQSISVEFTNLLYWIEDFTSFDMSKDYEDNTRQVKYSIEDPVVFSISNPDIETEFCRGINGLTSSRTINWTISSYFRLISHEPRDFESFRILVQDFRNLLSFFMGKSLYILSMSVEMKSNSSQGEGKNPFSYEIFQVFFPVKAGLEAEKDNISLSRILLPLHEIGHEKMQLIFQNWFAKKELLETTWELTLSVLFGSHRLPRFEFLSLIQAVEAFHRKKYGDKGYSLKRRLEHLLSGISAELKVLTGWHSSEYVDKVKKARHFYSHYMQDLKNPFAERSDLLSAISRLTYLVNILIFSELGLSDKQIATIVRKTLPSGIWQLRSW